MKILICEDDRISKALFQVHLQKLGIQVLSEVNGKNAYQTYLQNTDINFLLINWIMPEMSGLELCENIRALQKKGSDRIRPYIIMLTSNHSKRDLLQSLQVGADDFIKKPFDKDVLLLKINVGRRIVQAEESNKLYNFRLQKELEQQKQYLQHAQVLQKNLNTVNLPSSKYFDIHGFFMPCDALGGDFFDIYRHQNYLLIFIADYSGHGIKVAINAALCKAIVDRHIHLLREVRIDNFFFRVNNDILKYMSGGDFCTAFAGVIDETTNTMHYSSANHPLPYIVRKKNTLKTLVPYETTKNFFLGVMPDAIYTQKSVHLEVGDRLYFYSDALYEILQGDTVVFGEKELKSLLPTLPTHSLPKTIDKLMSVLKKYNGKLPLNDDCTLLILQSGKSYHKKKEFYGIDLLQKEMEGIRKKLLQMSYQENESEEVILVFEELFMNAFKHGNRGKVNKKIEVQWSVDYAEVFFIIRDTGNGFNYKCLANPTDKSHFTTLLKEFNEGKTLKLLNGRGVWMAQKYTSCLTYNQTGNEVKALFKKKEHQTQFCFH